MSCTCFLRCRETLRPNKHNSREFETDCIPHSWSESFEALWPHDSYRTSPGHWSCGSSGVAKSPRAIPFSLDVSLTGQNKLHVVIIKTCLFAFFLFPVFSSQTPEQQSHTKDSQGGFRRPGKPQISVSCPRVTFALALSSSARCWDDVAASPLRHSLSGRRKARGGGREGALMKTHPEIKSNWLVNPADSWCSQNAAYSAEVHQGEEMCQWWKVSVFVWSPVLKCLGTLTCRQIWLIDNRVWSLSLWVTRMSRLPASSHTGQRSSDHQHSAICWGGGLQGGKAAKRQTCELQINSTKQLIIPCSRQSGICRVQRLCSPLMNLQ